MQKVSDSARSDSGSRVHNQSTDNGESAERFAHIKLANSKVKLINVLRHYGFRIERNPQRPAWSNNIRCPMPSHKGGNERTPSFAYNFSRGYVHCFGCNFTGGAVEFIAAYEGISRTAVAERILDQYGDAEPGRDFQDYKDEITPILVEASVYLEELYQKHKGNPQAINELDKHTWILDMFLMAKAPKQAVTPEDLEFRVKRSKELLNEYFSNIITR